MFSNCAGEDSRELLGLQGGQTQSILKEFNPDIHWKDRCWSWCSNTLAAWCEEPANSLGKTLMLGKIEGKRRRGQQRMRWSDSITDSMGMNFEQTSGNSRGQQNLACYSPGGPGGHRESDMTWTTPVNHILYLHTLSTYFLFFLTSLWNRLHSGYFLSFIGEGTIA